MWRAALTSGALDKEVTEALGHLTQVISALAPERCPWIIGELEQLKASAWARMIRIEPKLLPEQQALGPERWLTVLEICQRYGCTPRWIYRHKAKMPHSQPTRKMLVFPERRFAQWWEKVGSRLTGFKRPIDTRLSSVVEGVGVDVVGVNRGGNANGTVHTTGTQLRL